MYNYQDHRARIFTENGQGDLIKVRDRVIRLLTDAGAFQMFSAFKGLNLSAPDTWHMIALVDRLVEMGDIRELTDRSVTGQERVFVSNK